MQNHIIEIKINAEGEIESEVEGILGPDCEGLTEWLEELGETIEHHRTPDYRRQQKRSTRAKIGVR